jgi:hypothetical protein
MTELTNLGLTAFNPPPNSPLIQGLLKLELPRDYYASEFDSATLRGPEIATLFLGHRVHGRYLSEGLEYGVSVGPDGTFVRTGNWGNGADESAGTARIEDDRLCFVLTTTTECGRVLRNPGGSKARENDYLWFSGGWVRPFSQVE